MSEQEFDPEKVTTWMPYAPGCEPDGWPETYKSAADYDRLLALYREAIKPKPSTPIRKCPIGCTCDHS